MEFYSRTGSRRRRFVERRQGFGFLRYWLSKVQKLYKRLYLGPYLLCVHPEAVEMLLEELHEGICGSHTGGRSLAHRALT